LRGAAGDLIWRWGGRERQVTFLQDDPAELGEGMPGKSTPIDVRFGHEKEAAQQNRDRQAKDKSQVG
jgi:hypothetical protein